MILKIQDDIAKTIRACGAEGYPNEVCGALLGRDDGESRVIVATFPLANQREDSPRNRFSITPADVRRAERAARDQKLDLIGWYHSHPDHPARPSAYDREHAWPGYSYVILNVAAKEPGVMTSWRLFDDRSGYQEETIQIVAPANP
jgi:proteasome lid subunit RPN8/RPN11